MHLAFPPAQSQPRCAVYGSPAGTEARGTGVGGWLSCQAGINRLGAQRPVTAPPCGEAEQDGTPLRLVAGMIAFGASRFPAVPAGRGETRRGVEKRKVECYTQALPMKHIVEVDQSGKVEDTKEDTVLALANGKQFSVLIPAPVKRACIQALRLQGRPASTFYLQLYTIALYFLLREHIEELSRVMIDNEYMGQEVRI
jgi:hypothetical protein